MLARRPDEAPGADDAGVLKIALAPSPVAGREVNERWRALLIGAAEGRQHIDRISRAPDERRLDEVVAENVTAKRGPTRQIWQAAMIGEGAGADDRVVAPIIAVASHPSGKARGENRAGDAGSELLHPREHRVAVDDQRKALNDAAVRVRLHRRGQPDHGVARHHAVGVEHQHVRISAAPPCDEVGDVAGLAARILAPPAIKDARARQTLAHRHERPLLSDPHVGVSRIGEKKVIERQAEAGAFDVFDDGLHRAKHA